MTPCAYEPTPLSDRALFEWLVSQASVSSAPSAPLIDHVGDYLRRAGCVLWRQDCDNGRKPNLYACKVPPGESHATGAGLLLSGHVDVVPADEPDWTSNPFALIERDGRLIGRGTADMKGFDALAINLLAGMRADSLAHPLALLLTSDEEIGTLGAQRFARGWDHSLPLPRSVIVGEPTDLRVVRMHKGHLKLRVTIAGRPAHSGYPHLGESAIARAGPVIVALSALADRWRGIRVDSSVCFPDCPYPVLNLGLIRGGSAVNIVPERCEITVGVRLLPGQTQRDATEPVEQALRALPVDVAPHVGVELLNDSPPMECAAGAAIHVAARRLLGQQESFGVSYASDAGALSRMGLDCILLGPGRIEDAHRANESIAASEFVEARRLMEQLVAETCGKSSE